MQWIFMLVGLLIGVSLDESITEGLLGALLGFAVGQWLQLRSLQQRNEELQNKLSGFAERFERGTLAVTARLTQVEERLAKGVVPPAEPSVAPAMAAAAPTASSAADELDFTLELDPEIIAVSSDDPGLVFELPPELLSTPPTPVANAPLQVVDDWTREPVAAPPPRQPPAPPTPREPNLFERGFSAAKSWLFGGNTVLRIGVVLLFLGLAFLLRYATEGMVVPIQVRYAGVAASAVALLALGWWLRRRNPSYALMLQGTGIAVLYMTTFAAFRLHPLLDPSMALSLLVVVTVCSAILAVTQNAMALAAVAALGGFAAPILTSTGSGNHVALFSYFILLNSGILAIAWFKAWRPLNLIGFVGTFGIGFAWGARSYTPELLWSTEPFLVLFFLMYVVIGLLFARRKLRERADAPDDDSREALLRWSRQQGDYVDGTLLFGPPLVGFGLQFALVQHIQFAAAFSALAMGLLYMLIARLLVGRGAGRALLLVETCMALGVIFGSLAIPLGLDARWTSAAWAVEGAGIFWLGLRQQRPLARAFALLLQFGAALAFLGDLRSGEQSLLDGAWLGALMLGVALLFSHYQLRKAGPEQAKAWERHGLPVLAVLGLSFLYLLAPLHLQAEATAICWALAGLATLFAGLRIHSRSFLFTAFAVQLLGGALFLLQLHGATGDESGVFSAGWRGLVVASLIGLALIGGMLVAARDTQVRSDARLMRGLSLVLLVGLVFINLAVLFVLPWQTASAVWAGSGLLIVWLSLHLQQRASFVFGLLLQALGGIAFLAASPLLLGPLSSEGLRPLAHAGFWTPATLALAAMVGAWRLIRAARNDADAMGSLSLERLSQLLLVWGAGWWVLAAVSEVLRFADPLLQVPLLLIVAAASVALWAWLAARENWQALALLCPLLVPAAGVALLYAWQQAYHPAAHFGWLGWALLFVVHLWALRRLANLLPANALSAAHVLGCWLMLGVLALELRYLLYVLSEHYNAWRWLGWAVLPSVYLLAMASPRNWPWPVRAYAREYRLYAALPLAVLMLGWFWLANIASDGNAEPLPYVPLINPLELGMLFALFGVCRWLHSALPYLPDGEQRAWLPQAVAGVSLFALFTALVFRAAHHWGGVPYQLDLLLESMLVQAGLSIVWTLIALALMIFGHLRSRREIWLVGAALIAVVVAKLFFVELGNRGGLERIVSFIGVGVLLLIVGYFAPLPPRQTESEAEKEQASS
ncbi:putative membrane protein [Pseudomonas sp. TE3786]